MLTSIFQAKFLLEKGGGLYQKQGQPQPHVHSKARTPSPQLQNGPLLKGNKLI